MANQKLNIDIVANDRSKQAFDRVQGSLARARSAVFNLRNAFIGLGAGLALRSIVNVGIQVENLGVQLKALFGSAREGQKALDIVTRFAATTPFELENIQQGITALATVRKQAERAGVSFEELLRITGNTATVLGGDFALASLQIQRSFSAGIASAELFRERGVTAMAGFSQGVRTSVEDSIKGLAKAFGTGGEFGNLTEELSRTLSGTISNLKDTLFQFQIAITRGFFFELKEQLGDLKAFTEQNATALESLGVQIGTVLADNIVKASNAIKVFVQNFRDLQSVIGLVTFALGGLIGKIAGIALIFDDIKRRTKDLFGTVEIEFQRIREIEHELSLPIEGINDVKKKTIALTARENGLLKHQQQELQTLERIFKNLNTETLNNIHQKFKNINQIIAENINSGITKMSEALSRSLILGEKLTDTLRNLALEILVKITAILIEQIARQSIQIAMENTQIGQLITKLGIEKQITKEKEKQNEEQKEQNKRQGTAMLMSGNPLGFLGFMANGGAVSKGSPYIVGENGPELFVPNQTGQVTQNARGTDMGGATTVNFNINTVDASGFEELLIRSRGTISTIINNAVNERGRGALI